MDHVKYIYACNNEGCPCEFIHIYVEQDRMSAFEFTIMDLVCPGCNVELTFCEKIMPRED